MQPKRVSWKACLESIDNLNGILMESFLMMDIMSLEVLTKLNMINETLITIITRMSTML